MKLFLVISVFCIIFLAQNRTCYAQNATKTQITKDTTPIEYLDHRLTKDEFMFYYGKDDTARAIVRMFYRKRGNGIIDFVVVPVSSYLVGGGVLLIGALNALFNVSAALTLIAAGTVIYVAGVFGIPIYYIIRRCIYTRQKLIYVLVGRERGQGIPENILENLRDSDF